MPLAAAALLTLLVGVLAGASGAGEPAGTSGWPRVTVTRTMVLAPGAFIVTDDDTSYDNAGDELAVKGPSFYGNFTAPLFFEDSDVRISSMTLYAYDNNAADDVCLSLYRTTPTDGNTETEDLMGLVHSDGAASGIRAFNVPVWNFRKVLGGHGPYLWLYLPGVYTSGYGFYGVRIVYTYEH